MSDALHVELPRFEERDQLVAVLAERGYDARAVDGDSPAIEIPCGSDSRAACDDLVAELESIVGELDVPLILARDDGVVFLRPPAA
ncbi:MAG: hypothetical protein ABR583_06485 [Gaiellaceae bacterium]